MRNAIKQIIPDAWNNGFPAADLQDRLETPWKGLSAKGQEHVIDVVHSAINKLPADLSEEWEPCNFLEIRNTDEAVMFAFEDGTIIQGLLGERCYAAVKLWVGQKIHEVTMNDSERGKAQIYRQPAEIVHPMPDTSPLILVKKTTLRDYDEGVVTLWDGIHYVSPEFSLDPNMIIEWHNAKAYKDA